MTLRNQPYGIDFDAALAASKVDIVEGEVRPFTIEAVGPGL
jgi:hypothetical protein